MKNRLIFYLALEIENRSKNELFLHDHPKQPHKDYILCSINMLSVIPLHIFGTPCAFSAISLRYVQFSI